MARTSRQDSGIHPGEIMPEVPSLLCLFVTLLCDGPHRTQADFLTQ